jgi:hypothetical protein
VEHQRLAVEERPVAVLSEKGDAAGSGLAESDPSIAGEGGPGQVKDDDNDDDEDKDELDNGFHGIVLKVSVSIKD